MSNTIVEMPIFIGCGWIIPVCLKCVNKDAREPSGIFKEIKYIVVIVVRTTAIFSHKYMWYKVNVDNERVRYKIIFLNSTSKLIILCNSP